MMPDLITSTSMDSEKDDLEQIEFSEENAKTLRPGQYDNKSFFGVRGLLKNNPSLEFCQEVVEMNKEVLNPAEVRKVRTISC